MAVKHCNGSEKDLPFVRYFEDFQYERQLAELLSSSGFLVLLDMFLFFVVLGQPVYSVYVAIALTIGKGFRFRILDVNWQLATHDRMSYCRNVLPFSRPGVWSFILFLQNGGKSTNACHLLQWLAFTPIQYYWVLPYFVHLTCAVSKFVVSLLVSFIRSDCLGTTSEAWKDFRICTAGDLRFCYFLSPISTEVM